MRVTTSDQRPARVGGLVLAAGRAHRFGGAKLLAAFRGGTLVSHVLATAGAARSRGLLVSIHAVVAEGDEPVERLARENGATPVVNPDPGRGLSSSLTIGLNAMSADLDAALVFLGDQPLVRLDVIDAVVRAWHQGTSSVVRPRYGAAPDVPGHPVLLARDVWPLAAQREGDGGFGARFAPGAPGVLVVDVPGDNPDVDTPADLLALKDLRR
ncbi:MAG TPA: nucleotidyltransferase family protein [Gemmatimonadales bacterium]|jgi:CTP:molybdopterin cytidylyltransferase MocA